MLVNCNSIMFAARFRTFGGTLFRLAALLRLRFFIIFFDLHSFCGTNAEFNDWILCSVFDICNAAMIFLLPNDNFYSDISFIFVDRITLGDWRYT